MALWLARKFDITTGTFTGGYYDIAETGIEAVFVCSYTGDDTNTGTALSPFKTLSKAISILNTVGAVGSRIFMNGIFNETLPAQTYGYWFIGCGGGNNGRVIFLNAGTVRPVMNVDMTLWQNVETVDYVAASSCLSFPSLHFKYYLVNCFIKNAYSNQSGTSWVRSLIYAFHTQFLDCYFYNTVNTRSAEFYGNNISFTRSWVVRAYMYGTNIHLQDCTTTSMVNYSDSLIDTLTDNQYFDFENNNLIIRQDSVLLFGGRFNALKGFPDHCGAGNQGFVYDGVTHPFSTAGGAIYDNVEVSGTAIIRTNPAIDASIESNYVYLGASYPILGTNIFNSFSIDSYGVTQGVFNDLSSLRPALSLFVKYGNDITEVNSCPWIEIEYGKRPSFSGDGENRVGNADNAFDKDNETFFSASVLKYLIYLKNRV